MDKKTKNRVDVGALIFFAVNVNVAAWLFFGWWGIAITAITFVICFTEIGSKVREKFTLTQFTQKSEWNWKKIYFMVSFNLFILYLNAHLFLKIWIWE